MSTQPSGVNLRHFSHQGGTLIDEVIGQDSGNDIIFLHGWGATREALRGVAAPFEGTHRVHLLDLPGFGDAPAPPESWGTTDYADLIEKYLSTAVPGTAVLVGHSFGGRVALRLAAREHLRVRGLVLMAVPGLPSPALSRRRVRRSAIRLLRRLLLLMEPVVGSAPVAWHTRRYASADYREAGALRSVFVRVVNEDLTTTAEAVRCPTLLLWGADDQDTPVWLAHRFHALMNGRAAMTILPHKDHYLYKATGAHLCAHVIRRWLDARP